MMNHHNKQERHNAVDVFEKQHVRREAVQGLSPVKTYPERLVLGDD